MNTVTDQVARPMDTQSWRQPASQVEAYLAGFLDERPLPSRLDQAIRYSLLGAGKRLRPILVVLACRAVGGRGEEALAPAAAIEMIHCFSLVHDDLPAMDDDDLRRGRPTLHKHTSEAMAILAGDAMVGLAFELLSTRVKSPRLAAVLLSELSMGTNDMIAGQVHDTLGDFPDDMDATTRLQTVHRYKTGALIRCACRMGAICGGTQTGQMAAVTAYGEAIGLMFQIVDDLLDVTATPDELGKASHKDADQGKLTYPGRYGVEGSRQEVDRLRARAMDALNPLGAEGEPLRALCAYMAIRTR